MVRFELKSKLSLLARFKMTELFDFRVVPIHPRHAVLLNSDPDLINLTITGDESWVYEYEPETKSFRHFPYN